MTKSNFDANLVADGYEKFEARASAPRPSKGVVCGLGIAGMFFVAQTAQPVSYLRANFLGLPEASFTMSGLERKPAHERWPKWCAIIGPVPIVARIGTDSDSAAFLSQTFQRLRSCGS